MFSKELRQHAILSLLQVSPCTAALHKLHRAVTQAQGCLDKDCHLYTVLPRTEPFAQHTVPAATWPHRVARSGRDRCAAHVGLVLVKGKQTNAGIGWCNDASRTYSADSCWHSDVQEPCGNSPSHLWVGIEETVGCFRKWPK